jgi:hypothetical protein
MTNGEQNRLSGRVIFKNNNLGIDTYDVERCVNMTQLIDWEVGIDEQIIVAEETAENYKLKNSDGAHDDAIRRSRSFARIQTAFLRQIRRRKDALKTKRVSKDKNSHIAMIEFERKYWKNKVLKEGNIDSTQEQIIYNDLDQLRNNFFANAIQNV